MVRAARWLDAGECCRIIDYIAVGRVATRESAFAAPDCGTRRLVVLMPFGQKRLPGML